MSKIIDWVSRHVLAGRPSATDKSYLNEVVVDDSGNLAVKVMGSSRSLVEGIHDQSSTVLATTGSEIVSIYASPVKIAEILSLGVFIPAITGATTGSHRLIIGQGTPGTYASERILDITAAYNATIQFASGIPAGTYTNTSPTTDVAALAAAFKRRFISPTTPLLVVYVNNTDAPQTGVRRIRSIRLEEMI